MITRRVSTGAALLPLLGLALGCGDVASSSGDASPGPDLGAPDLTPSPDQALPVEWSARASGVQAELLALWGASASDIHVVGEGGTLLHYDGGAFAAVKGPVATTLRDVWGSSATDVYVVGDGGTILHSGDGKTWSALTSGVGGKNLYGVGGTGPLDVYVVGEGGTILHSTDGGKSWPAVPPLAPPLGATLRKVLAIGETVWAAGDGGNFVIHTDHFGPWQWVLRNISSPENLQAVCVTSLSPLALFSAGDDGSLRYSFDGLIWPRQLGAPTTAMRGVWGSSSDDVYGVGDGGAVYHLGKLHQAFAAQGSGTTRRLNAVWGASAGDVYAVGEAGTILHRP